VQNTFFDFPGFDPDDFAPTRIADLPTAIDELSEADLRNLLVVLRVAIAKERDWQISTGYFDANRLVRIADMYVEAQGYYMQYDEALRERVNSDKYVPVLKLDGRIW
jgi:hypothetical protein